MAHGVAEASLLYHPHSGERPGGSIPKQMGERHLQAPPATEGYWVIDMIQDTLPLVVITATPG